MLKEAAQIPNQRRSQLYNSQRRMRRKGKGSKEPTVRVSTTKFWRVRREGKLLINDEKIYYNWVGGYMLLHVKTLKETRSIVN